MRRREFIAVGGAAAAWPAAARAQQPALPVIGVLNSASADLLSGGFRAFRQGLSETGHIEGRNVIIEYRLADGQYDRLPALAADLVRRQVRLIFAGGDITAATAKAATATIPIIFALAADPVAAGLVTSLARPGGNLTGVTSLGMEVGPKRLELLHEMVPTSNVIALLINPSNSTNAENLSRDHRAAARILGVELHVLHASNERDFETVFATLTRLHVGGLVIGTDAFFNTRIEQLAALALRHALPTIYQYPEFAAAGGLMSYGASLTETYRLVGAYAGRILKGEKPADLPVQQATRVELIINMKTAKALGLTFPLTLLGRADQVIE
jgi:putative ABC transport system substrate-binding protein